MIKWSVKKRSYEYFSKIYHGCVVLKYVEQKKHLNYKETESIMVNYFDNNIKMTGSHLDQIKLHRTDTKLRYTVSDNSLLSMNNSK